MERRVVVLRDFERQRGWLWCDRKSGMPVTVHGGEAFRELVAFGCIVKRSIASLSKTVAFLPQ
jgi:hypothetical protein